MIKIDITIFAKWSLFSKQVTHTSVEEGLNPVSILWGGGGHRLLRERGPKYLANNSYTCLLEDNNYTNTVHYMTSC